MKDVQCYEPLGGIAPKNHAFSFHFHFISFLISVCLHGWKFETAESKTGAYYCLNLPESERL